MSHQRAHRVLSFSMLVALVLHSAPVAPATIEINETCMLVDAVNAANDDDDAGGACPPGGSGPDTLILTGDVGLLLPPDGATGVPHVSSDISIEGNGFTIMPTGGFPFDVFRIFLVEASGTLSLQDVTLKDERGIRSSPYGGAILNVGTTTLMRVDLVNNSANSGGAIFNAFDSELTVIDSRIFDNSAFVDGAAISNQGTATIVNSTVSGNELLLPAYYQRGGAIFTSGTLTIEDSVLSYNSGDAGGAIYNLGGSTTVTRSELSRNSASTGGGAFNRGVLNVTSSTLSGNQADLGGGIYHELGDLVVNNSTISGNTGASDGGALWTGGTTAIAHSTLTGNAPDGIYTDGVHGATVVGSIIAGQAVGPNCTGPGGTGNITNGGKNLADDGTCGGFGLITSDVDFAATLADNGGPTRTHALLPGSVAIDLADRCGLEFDQRGYGRNDGSCDSGAFEFGALACPPCAAGELLVGLLSDLRLDRSCRQATCHEPAGLPPLDYLCSLSSPEPGDGYFYLE